MLLRWHRGTCNLEASLHRASTDFLLFGFRRGNTQIAAARNTNWRSSRSNVFNSFLFQLIGDPHTRARCWIFWRWPDATYRIPLFLWNLDCPSPIQSPIHATTNLSHHLRTRCSLHVAPRLKNSTFCDAVTNCCRLSQHSDAKVREKSSLGEGWSSDCSRSPARKPDYHALHFQKSSHDPVWWWTFRRK